MRPSIMRNRVITGVAVAATVGVLSLFTACSTKPAPEPITKPVVSTSHSTDMPMPNYSWVGSVKKFVVDHSKQPEGRGQ